MKTVQGYVILKAATFETGHGFALGHNLGAPSPFEMCIRDSLNACVIGSSGSGKTRFWLTPQLLQAHSSYVVVDPKGGTLDQCGRFLQREKYRVRVFNSIDFSKSMHYNPLAYIKTESDVLKFVTALIANTKGDGKEGDEFWTCLLYTSRCV